MAETFRGDAEPQDPWRLILQDLLEGDHLDSARMEVIELLGAGDPEWLRTLVTSLLDHLPSDYDGVGTSSVQSDWWHAGESSRQLTLFGPLVIETIAARSRPPSVLKVLALHGGRYARSIAARLSDDSELLAALERDPDPAPRWALAMRPDADTERLCRLALDESPDVRRVVAVHEGTPPDSVRELAEDPEDRVRAAVAARSDVETALLRQLSTDAEASVRRAAANNQNLPADAMARLAADPVSAVRADLLRRQDLPGLILRRALSDADASVRAVLLERDALPPDVFAALLADPSDAVAEDARRRLQEEPTNDALRFLREAVDELVQRQLMEDWQ